MAPLVGAIQVISSFVMSVGGAVGAAAGSAVTSIGGGGYLAAQIGHTVAGVVANSVVGATVGAMSSLVTGGDIGKGALYGSIGGAVLGGIAEIPGMEGLRTGAGKAAQVGTGQDSIFGAFTAGAQPGIEGMKAGVSQMLGGAGAGGAPAGAPAAEAAMTSPGAAKVLAAEATKKGAEEGFKGISSSVIASGIGAAGDAVGRMYDTYESNRMKEKLAASRIKSEGFYTPSLFAKGSLSEAYRPEALQTTEGITSRWRADNLAKRFLGPYAMDIGGR